jgi:hypothetical protein
VHGTGSPEQLTETMRKTHVIPSMTPSVTRRPDIALDVHTIQLPNGPIMPDREPDAVCTCVNALADSLGSDPVLRRLKDDEVVRSPSVNRNTVKAMEVRGLISPGKSRDPLKIVWRVNEKAKK